MLPTTLSKFCMHHSLFWGASPSQQPRPLPPLFFQILPCRWALVTLHPKPWQVALSFKGQLYSRSPRKLCWASLHFRRAQCECKFVSTLCSMQSNTEEHHWRGVGPWWALLPFGEGDPFMTNRRQSPTSISRVEALDPMPRTCVSGRRGAEGPGTEVHSWAAGSKHTD